MNAVRIDNWSIVSSPVASPYTAPELIGRSLHGVADHPVLGNGMVVTTSTIKSANGRVVTTQSRDYVLGKISPKYRRYLKRNYPNWDWRNPIKML